MIGKEKVKKRKKILALQKQAWKLTEDLSMQPNLKHPLKKMEKNDQTVGAQADRPAIYISVNQNVSKERKGI